MQEKCGCQYCKMNISVEERHELRNTFMNEVIHLAILDLQGIINTEENRVHFADMVTLFGFEDEFNPFDAFFMEDIQDEGKINIINAFASCFDSPFNFYVAMRYLENLRDLVVSALLRDTTLMSTPVLSKILTPAIFVKYVETHQMPKEILEIIDKAENVEVHSTLQ